MADWSALPEELLAQVVGRLTSLADRHHFGHVCRSWRSAAAASRPQASPHLPFLLLHNEAACGLFDVTCQKACGDLDAFSPEEPTASGGWCCFGGSHSWVGMVSRRLEVCLFNPFSGKVLRLPLLCENFVYQDRGFFVNVCTTTKVYKGFLPQKLCMSSPDPCDPNCIVMVIDTSYRYPKYTRAGCDRWRVAVSTEDVHDIIFHEGKFYAYYFYDCANRGSLAILDIGDRCGGDPGPNQVTTIGETPGYPRASRHYLVGFPGEELVLVFRHTEDEGDRRRTVGFVAVKMDISGRRRPLEWKKMGHCGAIFVGRSCSTSISALAAAGGGYRANCIYFTDDSQRCGCGPAAGQDDAGVFDLADSSVTPLLDAGKLERIMPRSPMWIVPNPR